MLGTLSHALAYVNEMGKPCRGERVCDRDGRGGENGAAGGKGGSDSGLKNWDGEGASEAGNTRPGM